MWAQWNKMKQNIPTAKKLKNLKGNKRRIPSQSTETWQKSTSRLQWLWDQMPQQTVASLNFRIRFNTSFYQHRSNKTNQTNKKYPQKTHKPPADWLIQPIRTFMSAAVHNISVTLLTYGNKEWHNTLEYSKSNCINQWHKFTAVLLSKSVRSWLFLSCLFVLLYLFEEGNSSSWKTF